MPTSGLNLSQIHHFRSAGYLVIDEFFDHEEVSAMQSEVERWLQKGLPRDVSTTPKERQNLQLIPLYPHSPLFRALPFSPKVVATVEALLGKPVIKILDQMFYKPAHSGMGTHWHTDNAYFQLADPLSGTAMWIAIHDADRRNGGLKVVPNAFTEQFAHRRDPDSDHHIHTDIDESRAVHCDLKAGGVVFFCFGTPHATDDNQSDAGRAGIGLHFVNGEKLATPFKERWQQVQLSKPGSTQGLAEYGGVVDYRTELNKVLAIAGG